MRNTKLTKLDSYDYLILPGVIRIHLSGTNDPDIVDIMSEIESSEGNIYIDGYRYVYLDNYRLHGQGKDSYMELDVVELS